MEASHIIIGAVALLAGYLLQPGTPSVIDRPCSCHCACALPTDQGFRWEPIVLALAVVALVIVGLCYAVLNFNSKGLGEYSFYKGKAGKGTFGARKGLQILDG